MTEATETIARDPYAEWLALNAFNLGRRAASPVDSPFVGVRPIGGGVDDALRLYGTIVPAAIANGQAVVLLPGTNAAPWEILTSQTIPSGAVILGTPETVMNVNLVGTTGADTPFTLAPGTLSTPAAMAVDVLAGATSITSPTSVPVGGTIVLSSTTAKQTMRYKVASLTGSGPFTLGLERPVVFSGFTVANGTTIAILTNGSSNVLIDGGGMLVKGVKAGGLADFALGYRCVLRNIIFDATGMVFNAGAGVGVSLAAALENVVERVTVLNPAASYGIGVLTSESTVLDMVRVTGGTGEGIVLAQSVLCTALKSIGDLNALNGAYLSGCTDCVIDGGSYTAATLNGILVDLASAGTKIINLAASYNGGTGVALDSSTSAVVDTFIDNVDAQFNEESFQIITGTLRTKMSNVDGSGCPFGFLCNSELVLDGYTSVSATSTHQEMQFGAASGLVIHARGVRIVNTQPTAIGKNSSALLHLTDVQVTMNATGIAYHDTSLTGVVTLDRFTVDGTAAGTSTGISMSTGETLRLGSNIDVDLCATPLVIASGAFTTRGQVTATSTTPVSVAWPKLKTTDRVTIKVHTLGTVTVNPPEPLIIQTAGVGFTVTSIATDTSVYDYTII